MTVVTISASYGAGGSVIAPRVAERLGVRFVDRAIPAAVARDLGLTVAEADALAQNASGRWTRFLAQMAQLSDGYALPPIEPIEPGIDAAPDLVARTEAHLQELATTGAVILGHGAAVVLADRPDALHVRLDGPTDARIATAMRQHGIDRDTAEAALRENDKLRTGYVRHFYHADATDPSLYDLQLNTTRFDWQQAEEVIVHAASLGDRSATAASAPSL